MITICSGNRKCTNEFIKYKSFGTIYPPPCSRNKTKKKRRKNFFSRALIVFRLWTFLSRFHSFESTLSNLISRWITNGRALPTPFGRRRCILHATAYYMPAITLRRCLIVGKNSFSTPSLPLAKPAAVAGFPSFPFLLLRNSVPN